MAAGQAALAAVALVLCLRGTAALRIAFGSCNRQDRDQSYWQTIADRRPDVWLWGGDIVYGDRVGLLRPPPLAGPDMGDAPLVEGRTFSRLFGGLICFAAATPQRLHELYAQQSAVAGYRALAGSVSKVLGIWDDHDMGLNDGDARYRWKAESQQALLDFLGEPPQSPRRGRRGVWDRYVLPGPSGRRVAVHLLDVRHNRAPYGDPGGDFLGEEQWAWLNESLRSARDEAAVNLVVSGLQVLRPWPGVGEVWGRFPAARARLLRTLASSGAKGLVLLSGDVHMAQLNAVRCGEAVVHELTSSGLTHSLEDYPGLAPLARLLMWAFGQRHLVGSTYTGRNFGELDIQVDGAGAAEVLARVVSLRPGRGRGAVVLERRLDHLSPGGAGGAGGLDAECAPVRGREGPLAVPLRLAGAAAAVSAALLAASRLLVLGARGCARWRARPWGLARRARKAHEA